MLKIVYSPEDGVPITGDLCMVSLGIQAVITAMYAYAVDENGEGRKFGEAATSVWPLLQVLMEPIADYFFNADISAPPKKADGNQDV